MRKKIKTLALRGGAFFLFLFFLALISLPNLVDMENYRSLLVAAIQRQVNGTVHVGKLRLYFDRELGVKISGISLAGENEQKISAEVLKIGFHFWPLFHRQLQVASVRLIRPIIFLQAVKGKPFASGLFRAADASLRVEEFCSTTSVGDSPSFRWCGGMNEVRLQIKRGVIVFTDRHFSAVPVTTRLREVDFSLNLSGRSGVAPFSLSAATVTEKQLGHLKIQGSLSGLSWPLDWGRIQLDCQVHGQNLDGGHYWPYYQKHVPMRHVGARVEVNGSYHGDLLGHFSSRGTIVLDDADLDYPRLFASRLPIRKLKLAYCFQLGERYDTIEIPEIRIETDDFSVSGSCQLDDIRRSRQGRIKASLTSNQLDLENIYRYLPVKIMPPQFLAFWEKCVPRGMVQIRNAYLNGSYADIAGIGSRAVKPGLCGVSLSLAGVSLKMAGTSERWQNIAGLLAATGEKITFSNLQCDLPPFFRQHINGSLDRWYHEPRLSLVDSFSLSLPDNPQLLDDFKAVGAEMLGRLPVVADALADCQQLGGRFSGTLRLDGRLAAQSVLNWQLDAAANDVVIGHPALGRPLKKIFGDLRCSSRVLELNNFSAILGQSPVNLTGRITDYRDPEKLKLDISIRSTAVHPEDLTIIPRMKARASTAAGLTSPLSYFSVKIKGFPGNPWSLLVDGRFALRHAAITLPWLPHELDDVVLTGDCQGHKLTVHEFSCRRGKSALRLAGSFNAEGNSCRLEVHGAADYLDPDDFLKKEAVVLTGEEKIPLLEIPLPFKESKLDMSMAWPKTRYGSGKSGGVTKACQWPVGQENHFSFKLPKKADIDIKRLSFSRGHSDFRLKGVVHLDEQGNMHGSLNQFSRRLQLSDIFPPPKKKYTLSMQLEKLRPYVLGQEISLTSHIGRYLSWNMDVDDLSCQATVADNELKIKSLTGSVWEGAGALSGTWALDRDLFSVMIDLRKVNLAQFNHSLALYSEKSLPLEGIGNVNLGIRWSGSDAQSWRRSLNGKVSFSFVKGRLKRFPVLANIASLLNVHQLLTLHLPDLSAGVPYDSLEGSLQIKDGVMATDDFLLLGPAVNISAGGSISLPDRQVDMEVGIQPLQAIDKAIAAVPVVGYIVTGEGKTFIVMRYSVRGPFGKTEVSAIPVRGLVEKTGGILKRLITTPVRMLRWPGKMFSPKEKKTPGMPEASGTTEDKKP